MIVLDTHAWVWWVDAPERLSRRAATVIGDADEVGVSAISCWELGMLTVARRIALDMEIGVWVRRALAEPRERLLPIDAEIALGASRLRADGFRSDSADLLIAATTLHHDATLVTRDRRLRGARGLRTVW